MRHIVMMPLLSAVIALCLNMPAFAEEAAGEAAADEGAVVTDTVVIPVDPVDTFLAQSAFIGNSVGEGLTMYNKAMGKPLGDATMLTRVSYSFYADRTGASKFLPVYNGTPMQAKNAVKQCGAKYVFISMGTNDLVGSASASSAYDQYLQYIAGILEENPGVMIFIESCTPTRPGSNVNNEKVASFNAMMKAYCDQSPLLNYVDIATPLTDGTGYLAASYSSDGSVHLTNKAYAIWADTVRAYIGAFLTARLAALHEQYRIEREEADANYRKNVKEMDDKKLEIRNTRVAAEREAERVQAEEAEALRLYRIKNVPDASSLMRCAVAKQITDRFVPAYSLRPLEEYFSSTSRLQLQGSADI